MKDKINNFRLCRLISFCMIYILFIVVLPLLIFSFFAGFIITIVGMPKSIGVVMVLIALSITSIGVTKVINRKYGDKISRLIIK